MPVPRARLPRLFRLLGLCLACTSSQPLLAEAEKTPYTFTFYSENDFYYGGSDRYYTNGIQLTLISPELLNFQAAPDDSILATIPSWLGRQVERMPWMRDPGRTAHLGLSLAQYMFTPEDISRPNPSLEDRPYAGWLNLGASYHTKIAFPEKNLALLDSFELNLGIVGPASLAEQAQKTWHSIIDAEEPMGWDYQLRNEPSLNLYWQRKYNIRRNIHGPINFEWLPQYGVALGNVHIHANAGLEIRAGYNLPLDFGVSQMRGASSPPLPGGSVPDDWGPWGFHLFAGAEGAWVGRNIFLDGNSFEDSRSVDKENWVATGKVGFGLRFDYVEVNFTMIWKTKEFVAQPESVRYGSITATFPLHL